MQHAQTNTFYQHLLQLLFLANGMFSGEGAPKATGNLYSSIVTRFWKTRNIAQDVILSKTTICVNE